MLVDGGDIAKEAANAISEYAIGDILARFGLASAPGRTAAGDDDAVAYRRGYVGDVVSRRKADAHEREYARAVRAGDADAVSRALAGPVERELPDIRYRFDAAPTVLQGGDPWLHVRLGRHRASRKIAEAIVTRLFFARDKLRRAQLT